MWERTASSQCDMSNNPHCAPWLNADMIATLESLKRLDEQGYLYYMDCLWDYDTEPVTAKLMAGYGLADAGCSVFAAVNTDGHPLTCRNYDYRHRENNTGDITGLNVVVRCAPKGKYRSIGVADGFWLDRTGGSFFKGVLDDGKTDISPAVMLPFICMDGMNEKGLAVSILAQPLRPGEACVNQTAEGKPRITYTVFMRKLLDECDSVENAVKLAQGVNMSSPNGADYRLFVSDAAGASVAFEWRFNKLHICRTRLSTNFYITYDDAQDRYDAKGELTETAAHLEGIRSYNRYGYGGGYLRYACILAQLERFTDSTGKTVITERRANTILDSAAQGVGAEPTSLTQYSVIYAPAELTQTVRPLPEYDKSYKFRI